MKSNAYQPRRYRENHLSEGLCSFTVSYRETDLWGAVSPAAFSPQFIEEVRNHLVLLRRELEAYLAVDPVFRHTLSPHQPAGNCPPIARLMAGAAAPAEVGPMAAVAGAFCHHLAEHLEQRFPITDLILENGGDIYLRTSRPRQIAISAGDSPLSNRIGLVIDPALSPLGICTSSGTVGHSLSFGLADAVTVLAADPAVADAYATAIGNRVKGPADIEPALAFARSQPVILGLVIVVGGRVGCQGQISLIPLRDHIDSAPGPCYNTF